MGRSVQGGEQRERKRAERAGGGWRGGWGRWDGGTAESESEVESCGLWSEIESVFWRKMVYGNFFRKPFSFFSKAFYGQITNVLHLTFILRRNKRLQMLKTFSAETN